MLHCGLLSYQAFSMQVPKQDVGLQGFRGKLEILERRRLDLDAARRQYNRLEQKRVKKSENNQEPPAELIIQIQAKETTLNGGFSNPPPPLLPFFLLACSH